MDHRRAALEAFKDGSVRFLICTDVAARGIDVKGLPFVINMTLPDEVENYIHRIGRVGRAELLGLAISIVAPTEVKEKVWYHMCGNRGQGCNNRSLVENGGCTIWFDETDLLVRVEERIHDSIPEITADFALPTALGSSLTDYGEQIKVDKYVPNYHMEKLAPKVKALAEMEVESQNLFLMIENMFP